MPIALSAIDRAFDDVLLFGTESNMDGDQSIVCSLPAGFGDCALMELSVSVTSIATIEVAFATSGVSAFLQDVGGVPQDVPVVGRWTRRQATQVQTWLAPDQVQFWKQTETLVLLFPEIDINATPTADANVYIKVRRIILKLGVPTGPAPEFHLTS